MSGCRLLGIVLLIGAGCSSSGNLPILKDPIGAGLPSPDLGSLVSDEETARAILKEHDQRLREGYPLHPGDKVRFQVVGQPELSFSAYVPMEGFLHYPHAGSLILKGRTAEGVRRDIIERLAGYLNNPEVTVFVEEYAVKNIYVLGAVNQAREYELPRGQQITLLQGVALGQGFKPEAEKRSVLLIRSKQIGGAEKITIPVDVVALTRTGRGIDPILLPGDTIYVPERDRVYVLGQVHRPGNYVATADYPTTISQAISMAGGFTRIAHESGVRLMRRGAGDQRESYVINVARILDGHPEEDVPLQPGDVVFVPDSFF
ncbi:MAG: SLBB domain-containing protein [Planctomycetes bacterium]|nr:SLBB domain-containing protein [Planctomycetota bacterium]